MKLSIFDAVMLVKFSPLPVKEEVMVVAIKEPVIEVF
jgi:hypothetical protein